MAKEITTFWNITITGSLFSIQRISHGEKELESFHIGMMSRQCKLDKQKFIDLAKCPLSAENYIDILKQSGIISEADAEELIRPENRRKKK